MVPMQSADLDAVMEIERLAYRTPWVRQLFIEELGRDFAHIDLVKVRERGAARVVAFANYWLVRDEVHILNVATHPDARRQGHAARLLEQMLAVASRRGCRLLTLEVRRSNVAALALYARYDFRQVGIRVNYYVDDREDAIVMLRELDVDGGAKPTKGGES